MSTMLTTTPSSESSDYHPRKRMRKGTHSCLECRRRKIRCIYEGDSSKCNRCTTKSLNCTEQEYGDAKALGADKRKSMRERTGELEGMIGQILQKLDSNGSITGTGIGHAQTAEMKAAEALRCLRTELLPSTSLGADVLTVGSNGLAIQHSDVVSPANEASKHFHNAPILSLFDNVVLSKGNDDHDSSQSNRSSTHQPLEDKNRRVLTALKTLIPSRHDLGLIIRSTRQSIRIWHDSVPECGPKPSDILNLGPSEDIQQRVFESLHSDNIAVVAKSLVSLALAIQQLPGTFDFSTLSLPTSPEAIQDHYMTVVDTLLASDEGIASTIDGLFCLLIQSKFYVNLGRPRKGWLTIRRAVSIAQMLGFHRQTTHDTSLTSSIQRRATWMQIFMVERYLCLLLGYPTAVLDAHYDCTLINERLDNSFIGERFLSKLSVVIGQVINRNQDPNSMTVAVTAKIDQDLEDARTTIPEGWWDADPGPDASPEEAFDKFVAKTFYYNVRMLLHLPFTLKTASDRRYEYSRVAALESSREMILHYHNLRDPVRPLVAVCNVIDFQVFTAAMLLIVNLLGHSHSSNFRDSDEEQDERDWRIIHLLLGDLRKVVNGEMGRGESAVAAQAVKILEDFSKARDSTACHKSGETYQVVIPYFGKIRVRWGKGFRGPRTNSQSYPSTTASPYSTSSSGPLLSNPGTFNTSLPSQLPTPSDTTCTSTSSPQSFSCANPSNSNANTQQQTTYFPSPPPNMKNDPSLSFDTFYQPLPGEMQFDNSIDWSAMNGFELLDDWGLGEGLVGVAEGENEGFGAGGVGIL